MPKGTSPHTLRQLFRERLRERRIVVAPGVGDALGARLVQSTGFEAVYMSGFAVEGTYGKPDVGLLTLSEMADRAAQIADAVDLPLLADADTGYGDAVNVVRTVRMFERAGVAGLQFEDQSLPKKCGSMASKQLVSCAEMVGKISAAVDARTDPNMLIIGRTDAIATNGIEEAIERLHRYAEAGADVLMALGPYDLAQAARLMREAPKPFLYLNSESFTMPMIPVSELETLGTSIAVFPLATTLAAAHAMRAALMEIMAKGTTEGFARTAMLSWSDFNNVVGLPAIEAIKSRYIREA